MAAIPKVLKQGGMNLSQIDLIELNEAFASQALAVIREAGLNSDIVNINGGAIALGHPLGCTGCKLTIQILSDMKRLNKKYGIRRIALAEDFFTYPEGQQALAF